MKILVLDDSEMMRKILVKQLLAAGVVADEIQQAHDGVDAIRKINSQTFDLMLLDIVMDGVDGIAVLREAKKSQPNARVIMCSTFSEQETVKELINLGIDDFILKPFSKEKIQEILRHNIAAAMNNTAK